MIISEWKETEQEKTEILNLAKKAYGKGELMDTNYFDWQYRKNPQGKAILITAKDENANHAIVGVNAFLPMDLMINQKLMPCLLSCNSIVDPDYRKRGIFTKIISQLPEIFVGKKIACIYGIPNSNSFKIFTKNQFLEIAKLQLLGRPIRLSNYFNQPLTTILKPFDFFWKIKKNINSDVESLNEKFGDEFDELIKKVSTTIPVIHFRNKEYLQWRYIEHPTRNYQVYVLRNNSGLIGYIITREMETNRKKIGVIVDFLVDNTQNQEKNFQKLLFTALKNFWENNIAVVIATSRPGLSENKILTNSGFFSIPTIIKHEQLYFIVSILEKKNLISTELKSFDNWFFSLGDYDVF